MADARTFSSPIRSGLILHAEPGCARLASVVLCSLGSTPPRAPSPSRQQRGKRRPRGLDRDRQWLPPQRRRAGVGWPASHRGRQRRAGCERDLHLPGPGLWPRPSECCCRRRGTRTQDATASLCAVGIEPGIISGGSTPTAALTHLGTATEVRPGSYVFNDAQQLKLGSCTRADIALSAWATVVSRASGQFVLDAGSKVLGADRPTWASGYGRLADYPEARLIALSEHHATVAWPGDLALPALGTLLRVVPNHVCSAVNLANELVVMRDGVVVDCWRVAARGANS